MFLALLVVTQKLRLQRFLERVDVDLVIKLRIYRVSINACQRSLPRARRPPKRKRESMPLLERQPQRLARTHEMPLPDKPLQTLRPYTISKRFHEGLIIAPPDASMTDAD